jgi:hypothetical protein
MDNAFQISIEDLRNYRHRKHEIMSIDEEIKASYYPLHSAGSNSGGHGSTPGDPTAQAVKHIEALRNKAEKVQKKVDLVDMWLVTCQDSELAAICRLHYCAGKSWGMTAAMLNYERPSVVSRVNRYFGCL